MRHGCRNTKIFKGYPVFHLSILLLFLFNCMNVVSASDGVPSEFQTSTLLTVLTEHTDQKYPAIYGDMVLWVDSPENGILHLYNISDGNETVVISDYTSAHGMIPKFFGQYISLINKTDSGYQIILHDLFTGEDSWVAGGNATIAWNNDLENGVIVWQENRIGSFDIYYKNLTTWDETLLTTDSSVTEQSNPKVSGSYIVWQSLNPDTDMHDIYLRSLLSGNTSLITPGTDETDELHPAIDGSYVVFQGMNPDTLLYDIYLYNISSQETILITPATEEVDEEYPIIHNGKVVWIGIDPDDLSFDFFLYDIITGFTRILERDNDEYKPELPAIFQDRIVWQEPDPETGYSDIYMMTLGVDDPPLTADFSADTTTGGVPLTVNFTDLSSGEPSGWLWDFGDGATSTEQNPVHTYSSPGVYDVSLIIHTPVQRSGKLNSGFIFVGSPPITSFSFDKDEGLLPLTVKFSDHSTGYPDSYFWDFGDGTSSSEMNPVHIYTSPGSYDVSLTTGNEYGNSTATMEDCILVMGGRENEMILGIPGISYIGTYPSALVTLNSSLIPLNVIDNSTVEAFPGSGFGIARMNFTSEDGFAWTDPTSLSGVLTDLMVESPTILYGDGDHDGSVWFQITMGDYPVQGVVHTEVWENATPFDYEKFDQISIDGNDSGTDTSRYSGVKGVAFTARFGSENISSSPSGVLLFAIDSDWIQEYGWRKRVVAESDQEDTKIYLDGDFLGFAPVELPSNLSAGDHKITGTKNGFKDNVSVITLGDKRDSIRVIRVAEDGSGEILTTEFLYHDPETNLDYFRAESPHGFSTFGVVTVSKAGNPIQILFLLLQELFNKLPGGGGHSSLPSPGEPAPSPTTIPTKTGVPTEIHTITNTVSPTSTHISELTGVPTTGSGTGETPAITPTSPKKDEVPPPIPPTLIQTIAIVSGVIIVVSVLLLRWQKGGEQF